MTKPNRLDSPAVQSVPVEQSDEDVVTQILAGNTPLFELLMRRHNERLYRAARAITRDDREAEDVMQQAYVNAFASLRQFKGQAQFATWLTRIAINEALARVHRRGRYEAFDEAQPQPGPVQQAASDSNPEHQAFRGEVRRLAQAIGTALEIRVSTAATTLSQRGR
jgi:RNA polymerase sigma-70 factor (ECF subfamily)